VEQYSREFTSWQLDSICQADSLPALKCWKGLYVKGSGRMYLYADSSKVYRVYKQGDGYNVTKRINK